MRSSSYVFAVLGLVAAFGFVACSSSDDDASPIPALVPTGNPNGSDNGGECSVSNDCKSGVCVDAACAEPTHADGVKNGDETGLDCGGATAPKCVGGQGCNVASDCTSDNCESNVCGGPVEPQPTATDGVKNGSESDIDCGGTVAPKCKDGKSCLAGTDCTSDVCTGNVCQAPTATDGAKNGDETDIDCGGSTTAAPACGTDKACNVVDDCASRVCDGTTKKCSAPTATDGVKNGDEGDIDCGGTTTGAAKCGTDKTCNLADDCASLVCDGATKKCKAPTATDGVKNGDEGDIDCGGTTTGAAKCAVAKTCNVHADCATDGCDDTKHCALGRSCTQANGGRTCGSGEVGEGTAVHESCCVSIDLPGKNVKLDKYEITAGRMRAFLERVNGNVRAFVKASPPAGWDPSWDNYMPTGWSIDPAIPGDDYTRKRTSVWHQLGPSELYNQGGQIGCNVGGPGTHTYWMPQAAQDELGEPYAAFSQAEMDVKALTCATQLLLAAFCSWDGGRLPTIDELDFAWNKGTPASYTYPWGNTPVPAGYNNNGTVTNAGDFTVANFSHDYYFPIPSAAQLAANDYSYYISAPGRFPKGNGPYGHADLAGNLFDVTSTLSGTGVDPTVRLSRWSRNGSWEGHQIPYPVHNSPLLRKYGKQGGRCAR